MSQRTNAEEMARRVGKNGKSFRGKLRQEKFPWYRPGDWTVIIGNAEHRQMEAGLKEMRRHSPAPYGPACGSRSSRSHG